MIALGRRAALLLLKYKNIFRGNSSNKNLPDPPQQDIHIEAYHFIMESCVCQRFEFNDLNEARKYWKNLEVSIILRENMEELSTKAHTGIYSGTILI